MSLLLLMSGVPATPVSGSDTATATDKARVGVPGVSAHTSQTPALPDLSDGPAVTTGGKYVFDGAGKVHAVRFWVPTTNTGTYTGALYQVTTADGGGGAGAGSQLASATMLSANVDADGWAVIPIAPQSVTPGVVYLAALHSPSGHYVATSGVFTSAGISNAGVNAIQSGTNPSPPGLGIMLNGTYDESGSFTYPAQNFGAPDYFVDVVYVADGVTPIGGSDTATAVDAGAVGAAAAGSDTATAVDTGFVRVSGADTASGVDTATLAAAVAGSDTASGADTASVGPAGADTATGVDVGSVSAALSGADTATGVDVGSLATPISGADTATAVDTATVAATLAGADTATAVDVGALAATLAGADTATAVDAAASTATLAGADTASAVETGSVLVLVTGADTAAGVDAGSVKAAAAGSDTATGVDAGLVSFATVFGSDTATAAEAASVFNGIARDLVISVAAPTTGWAVGQSPGRWAIGVAMLRTSVLSREYVRLSVTATVGGVVVDPTTDVVQMAFVAPGASPGVSDWKSAAWEPGAANGTHTAICLVGPGGDVVLPVATYAIWLKITDSPEIPVRPAGGLQIF